MKITVSKLSFSYENKEEVLKDISFNIDGCGITVLLGLNGCGKTTLLDCIIGYHPVGKERIFIDGRDINRYTANELAHKISYVPQKVECKIDYTVYEYILMGRYPYIRPGRHPSKNDCDIAKKYMEQCRIAHLARKEITQISGGELQIVSLARALSQETEFIIMDEPFSALDFSNQSIVVELIKRLSEEKRHILLTTHNPNHALHMESSAFLMKGGRIIKWGMAEEVINVTILREIFGETVCLSKDLPFNEVSLKLRRLSG
ncbi:MAG: ABC transporter ATP-binding protein [Lachnospiraceae bacterium]|nr:ABC transporter ATP-binding protein [Lachnospiraceae bacterium]